MQRGTVLKLSAKLDGPPRMPKNSVTSTLPMRAVLTAQFWAGSAGVVWATAAAPPAARMANKAMATPGATRLDLDLDLDPDKIQFFGNMHRSSRREGSRPACAG